MKKIIGTILTLFLCFMACFVNVTPATAATGKISMQPGSMSIAVADEVSPSRTAPPMFSIQEGTYSLIQVLDLTCKTPGADIRYTTDGTEPSASSEVFSQPIPIAGTTTVKAYAKALEMEASGCVDAVYTIMLDAGDMNGDGRINSIDYLYISKYIIEPESVVFPIADYLKAGDLNGDNLINSIDLLFMKKYLIGDIEYFPKELPPPADAQVISNSSSGISIAWQPPSEIQNIARYQIYRDGFMVGDTDGTQYTDTLRITPNTYYIYTITATDTDGKISHRSQDIEVTSSEEIQEPLLSPVNLRCIQKTDTTVTLRWDAAEGSIPVAGYDIYDGEELIGSVEGDTVYTSTGLTQNVIYSFTVKARDSAGNTSEASDPLVMSTGTIISGGTITADTTWESNFSPYILNGSVTVASGAVLTVSPGVIVKATSYSYYIDVRGKLNAIGTSDNPIVFTSSKDPEYGGSGVVSGTDYWSGISVGSSGEFTGDYVKLRYGGYSTGPVLVVYGKLLLADSEVSNSYGQGVSFNSAANVLMKGCTVNNLNSYGVYIDDATTGIPDNTVTGNITLENNIITGSGSGGIYINQYGIGNLNIKNNDIYNNSGHGICVYRLGTGNYIIEDNIIANNSGYPVYVHLGGLSSSIFSSIQGNTYTNNIYNGITCDGIGIYGTLIKDLTLTAGKYYLTDNVIIPTGNTLTVQPGTIIYGTNYRYCIEVQGKLNAIGTSDAPIVFTSHKDSEYGGSGVVSGADYWGNIKVGNNGEFNGEHIRLRYYGHNYSYKALEAYGKLTLTNCEGNLYLGSGVSALVKDCNLSGVMINNTATANILLEDNIITNGVQVNGFVMGDLNIINNDINNCLMGIDIEKFGTGNCSIENNIFNSNQFAIWIDISGLDSSIFSYIKDNTYINNAYGEASLDGIFLYGDLKTDMTLIADKYYIIYITIPKGITLTVQPGAVIVGMEYLHSGTFIDVQGKLNAVGTTDTPIVFTSCKDPAYGGTGVTGIKNDYWRGINVDSNGEFIGNHVKLRYGGHPQPGEDAILKVDGKLSLANSEVSGSYNRGIHFNTTTQPTLICNSILNNKYFDIYNAIPSQITIDASYNYWGSIYGPGSISAGVEVYPYLGSECTVASYFGQDGTYGATGNYSRTFTDMSLNTPGFTLNLSRTYNSKNNESTVLGKGWTFGFEGSIKDYENNIPIKVVRLPNGSVEAFNTGSDGTFTSDGSRSTLAAQPDGTYILTTKDQYTYGFNANGWMTWMKDRDGNTIAIQVDGSSGKVQAITDQCGRSFTLSYNGQGLLDAITGPENTTVSYRYENSLLTKSIDAMGHITSYSYDSQGFLTEIRDDGGKLVESVSYLHDDSQNKDKVGSTTDAYGNTLTYEYDNANRKFTITDSSSRRTAKWYNSSMNITIEQDAEGRQAITEYYTDSNGIDKYGDIKSVTDRNGNKTQYGIDGSGNVTKITNPDASFRTYTYDSNNNMTSEKDETGRYIFYVYDNRNLKLLKKAQPLNGTDVYADGCDESKFAITTYTYYTDSESQQMGCEAKGLLKSEADPENSITAYTYDRYGNTKTVTDPEGRTTSYDYDAMGRVISQTSPGGYVTSYTYDKNGNMEKKTLHGGETERTVYDSNGRKTKEISPNIYNPDLDDLDSHAYNGDCGTRHTYYDSGKIRTVTDAQNNTVAYTYDLYGNILTETKPNGAVYRYEYDVMDRLLKVYFSDGPDSPEILLEQYAYTILSNKKTQTVKTVFLNDTGTAITTTVYDYAGRQVSQQNSDGTTITTNYNSNGTVYTTADARGSTTYYRYDGMNRLSEKWIPVNTGRYSYKKIAYDSAGRQKQIQTGRELVALYDLPVTFAAVDYDYYSDGALKSVTDSAGRRTDYAYDSSGVLSKEDVYVSSTSAATTEYVNNHLGKPVQMRVHVKEGDLYGNDFESTEDSVLTTYYAYDSNGNLKTATTPDGITTTYTYDSLDRQTGVSRPCKDEYGGDAEAVTSTSYDWQGNILTVTDPNGNTASNRYNGRGFLHMITDAGQGITAYYYDTAGRKTAEVSPQNYDPSKELSGMNRVEYSYDSMGRLKTRADVYKDPSTDEWTTIITRAYKYDANGNIIKELDALGYEAGTGATADSRINTGYGTEYTYNLENQLSTVLDPALKQRGYAYAVKYDYDGMGRKVTQTNVNGVITGYGYDDAGNVTKTTVRKAVNEPEQVTGQAEYDLTGNVTKQTDGNGNITSFEYNSLGKLRRALYPADSTIPSNIVKYQYDGMGNLKKQQDSMNRVDEYIYDSNGRQTSMTQKSSDGTQSITTEVKYDLNGNKRFETDANNVTKESTYDPLNRLKTTVITVSGEEQTTSYDYDKNGNLLSQTDWRGNTYTSVYDPVDRLIEKRDPYGKVIQRLEYNHNGVQIKSYDALNNATQYTYDRSNRLLSTIDPLNHTTSQTYDNVGNISSKKDGRNNSTSYTYDEFNRLKTVLNAKSEATGYTYDLDGNMLTQKDGKGNITSFEYNVRNKLIRKIYHGGRTGTPGSYTYDPARTESYIYNAAGQLSQKTDRNGTVTTYTYDIHGNLLSETSGTVNISHTYDGNGNKLTMTDGTGITARTYDELGRVLTKEVPNIGTTTYDYDIILGVDEGCTKEISTDPKGNIREDIYDRAGRLLTVTANGRTAVYSYYDNGSTQSVVYDDGSREDYTYYDDGHLWTLTNKKSDGTVLEAYTYTYDASENQTSKDEVINGAAKGITSYTYDALNRLQTVTEPGGSRTTAYTYDASGNRLTQTVNQSGTTTLDTYSYDSLNRLTGVVTKVNSQLTEAVEYGYDNNGNQLSRTVNGLVAATNTYDELNRLVSTQADGITAMNVYNGEGMRVEKSVDGSLTRYLYEYDRVVLETDEEGEQTGRNIYGINLIERLADGQAYQYMYNGHGDVTALLKTDGTIAVTYYYDAFGNITDQTGEASNIITYAGYQYDSETGLYYLNARMYDPVTARFMQEDTYTGEANDPLSLNLYTYCHNEPIMYTDPTGHIAFSSWQDAAAYSKAITQIKTTTKVTTSSQAKAYTQAAQKAVDKYSAPTPATNTSTTKTTTAKAATTKAVTGNSATTTTAKASNNVQGKAKVTTLEEAVKVSKKAEAEKASGTQGTWYNKTLNAAKDFTLGTVVSGDNNMFFGGAQAITGISPEYDTTAFKLGKIAGDIGSIFAGGGSIAGGMAGEAAGVALDATGAGAAVGVPLNVASAGAIIYGGTVIINSAGNLINDGINLASSSGGSKGGSGRGANSLKSDPAAQGNAHSTFKTDPKTGKVTNYETYQHNPRNPNGVDKVKRYDGTGDSHYNKKTGEDIDSPHVHDPSTPGGIRKPNPNEIPK
ncbi:RHS repeat-associated protein [Anaerobacterium chartisolvens]|uniref:RHS repeat-associated protein n=1 Tax=Anaerobacterium chartisolvens TaxID=1297424 RepID=A0A369AV50_9FIRM|nr:RHS repeat-associated core domain-containing protein [Anaerobacterium chartisolvens]RCX12208.1 RHS repeat-associated protein [Anaerobacterium chartisolvens]